MKKGDFVKISYTGKLETGEIFDLTDAETAKKEGIYSSKIAYGDLPIIVGANFMIKGLDNALLDLNVGDKKDIEIKPEDGFISISFLSPTLRSKRALSRPFIMKLAPTMIGRSP